MGLGHATFFFEGDRNCVMFPKLFSIAVLALRSSRDVRRPARDFLVDKAMEGARLGKVCGPLFSIVIVFYFRQIRNLNAEVVATINVLNLEWSSSKK